MCYIWSSFISVSRSASRSDYGTVVVGNPNALVGNPNKKLTGRKGVWKGWNFGVLERWVYDSKRVD